MPVKAYLGPRMLARLLACLALVTGLAAVGAPVQAKVLQAASEQVESASPSSQPGKNTACATGEQRNLASATEQAQAKCRARKPVTIYIPTVQLGVDRAYE